MPPDRPIASRGATEPLVIASSIAAHVVEWARHEGLDVSAALLEAGITEAELHAREGQIPLTRHFALWRAIGARTDDPLFALECGAATALPSLRALGPLLAASSNLATAFGSLASFSTVLCTGAATRWVRGGHEATMSMEWKPLLAPVPRPATEGIVAFWHAVSAALVVAPPRVLAVRLPFPDEGLRSGYEAHFGCRVFFGTKRAELGLHPDDVLQSVRTRDAEVEAALRAVLERQRDRRESTASARVRAALDVIGATRETRLATLARYVSSSPRALQRRLAKEGTDFARLLEENLAGRATVLLASGATIDEVAFQLGYRDRSAFHRAFARWTGRTPGSVRKPSH